MVNVVVGAIVVLIVGSALAYIIKSKKNGIHCIGCPDAGSCASCKNSGCGCKSGGMGAGGNTAGKSYK